MPPGQRIEQLEARIDEAHERLDVQREGYAKALQRIDDLTDELAARDERIDELESHLEAVSERTNLLQYIRQASSLAPEERAAVLIQTLHNEATRRGQKNNDESASASIDKDGAMKALGGTVERGNIYYTFEKAEQLVGNDDVCWYQKEPRSSEQNSRLVLSLENGGLPDEVAGHAIGEGP